VPPGELVVAPSEVVVARGLAAEEGGAWKNAVVVSSRPMSREAVPRVRLRGTSFLLLTANPRLELKSVSSSWSLESPEPR
jgi:hypothetical protein